MNNYIIKTNTTNEKGGINAMAENLRIVKNVAIVLLEVPVKVRKLSLSNGKTAKLINHPILPDCGIINAPEDKEQPFYSIMSSDANMQKAIQRYKGFIEEAENIDAIFLLINRPYRLQFLELIQRGLSPDEMGELLAYLWVDSENPNNSAVSLPTLIKWFKKASKQSLMDAEELAYYNSLPDEFTVYRGIGSKTNKKGISYTLSLEKAEWFANRFQQDGYVLTGTAKKKDVLAYLNGREEQTILIEPKNIASLHKM